LTSKSINSLLNLIKILFIHVQVVHGDENQEQGLKGGEDDRPQREEDVTRNAHQHDDAESHQDHKKQLG